MFHIHEKRFSTQPPFWLGEHEWVAEDVLPFANGLLNVRRYVLGQDRFFIPPTPRLFYEWHAPFDFDAKAPPPVEWQRFLESLGQDGDWCRNLQQIMGYTMWRKFDLQKLFALYGPPRSGKNTITTVMENMGGGACGLTLDDFVSTFGLEQAIGKRLAIVPEVERGPLEHEPWQVVAQIKAITGGDLVTVNRKHIKNISMRLPIKIVMLSNRPAALPDNSGAIHARMIPLKLTKSFLGKEDITLGEKLRLEYAGIMLWCLDGLRNLHGAGQFTLCQSTKDELEQLLGTSAPLQRFLEDRCTIDVAKGVHSIALHKIYTHWLYDESPGEEPLSEEQFGIELRAAAPVVTKQRASSKEERNHKGVAIVATAFDSPSSRPWLWCGVCPMPEYCKVTP